MCTDILTENFIKKLKETMENWDEPQRLKSN